MKKKIVLVLFVFIGTLVSGQRGNDPSEEDVAVAKEFKKSYPDEDIVLLSKTVVVEFAKNVKRGFVEATTRKTVEFLNISQSVTIQYPVFYDSESTIGDFTIYDRRGKKTAHFSMGIRDEYLENNDMFHTDYRVKYTNLSFPLQGTRYKVSTEKKYNDVKYFTSEYFVDAYRIKEGKLVVKIPSWLTLELKEFNFEEFAISKEETTQGDTRIVTYAYKNAASQVDENDSPGPSFMYPHILFLAKFYTEDAIEHKLFNDVSDLYAWYNGLVQNVEVDASVYADKVKELTATAISDTEKVKNIFYWVQDNIRYIAFEDGIAGFQPDSPQNVFTKRYGDCKGMAILTKSMLEEAGLDSRLVWIGTDRLAYDYSTPSLSVDNHMICSVQLDGETIFLDATENYNKLGEYASRIQNKQALIQGEDSFEILRVPMVSETTNVDKTSYNLSIAEERLIGNATRFYEGECRVLFQNNYTTFGKGEQEDVLQNYLSGGNKNIKVSQVQPFDQEERDLDLTILYTIVIESAVAEFEGTIYVDIDPIKSAGDYIFKDRKVDYKSRMNQKTITEVFLEIPQGYTVEQLPENVSVDNQFLNITVMYELQGKKLLFTKVIDFKRRWVKRKEFDSWNASFLTLKENLNQQITLVKQ
ncbi:transglutaminase-like domain-containing protein [Patiriisocius sp. Uisw_017]|jgi:transglutaminase-like putative cysteine protease|uniref:transglutaminase-like domain-containing protein n=1 Tax=Patiriisocius sp. Uisw_017 TaxID=3230968 RepID=UPI0039ECE785